ncbi:MAG: arginase [Gammaproteobacteria bacterium]|nr:arginase [Gammaproteobacteria bacterium]
MPKSEAQQCAFYQKNHQINVISATFGLGSPIKGCENGPLQLATRLQQRHPEFEFVATDWLFKWAQRQTKDLSQAFIAFSKQHAASVNDAIENNDRFIVLGGDHSIAASTWPAVIGSGYQDLGLLWLDAHLDAHTPATTPSGNLHGMPLALLLGHGEPRLLNAMGGHVINPKSTVLYGVRSFEKDEFLLLQSLGVRVYFMDEIKQRGFELTLEEALSIVAHPACGFGISLDLDVFDPVFVSGVSTPAKHGLEPTQFIHFIQQWSPKHPMIGLEIAEYNPLLDQGEKTGRLVEELIECFIPYLSKGKNVAD